MRAKARMLNGNLSAIPFGGLANIFGFLYRKNDTLNFINEYRDLISTPFKGSPRSYLSAGTATEAWGVQKTRSTLGGEGLGSLHNAIGRILTLIATPNYADYSFKAVESIAVLRGAALQAQIMAGENIEALLKDKRFENPLNGEMPALDRAKSTITISRPAEPGKPPYVLPL